MYTIGKFAKKIGVSTSTLRAWDKADILKPAIRSDGNQRLYSEEQVQEYCRNHERKVTLYFTNGMLQSEHLEKLQNYELVQVIHSSVNIVKKREGLL